MFCTIDGERLLNTYEIWVGSFMLLYAQRRITADSREYWQEHRKNISVKFAISSEYTL